ncbi:MAG: DUF1643 domain-containing protein [Bacteroidetes bacterium]|mgnify:CR=1 FL=1|jgi:hypothetical protein|nr:DUF1643 domain-containing protein [Bacteroidota bacterium]MBT3749012.1 DUF1643 domain-containing protein [Bacteroidota bacterium]MBT4400059.1 DUF1643 domain-containing protein [Bacteroidota bacterium]MBT4409000.1 DUF1643 domain-containing protein [Bacteroidota bacterium]MBT5427739.1 DUF1643 domain-containing protein [Bacteroidota bacterium]
MARLGRQLDHFDLINLNTIRADFSPDQKHRYTLQMDYLPDLLDSSRSETTTVILKNPSSANEQRSDATIRKVETFVYKRFPKTKYLNILNIFAFRATDAIELHQLMQSEGDAAGIGADNNDFFKKLLADSNELIFAWGGPSGIDKGIYGKRIADVKEIVAEHYSGQVYQVLGQKPTKEPLHGLMWGYEYDLIKISL